MKTRPSWSARRWSHAWVAAAFLAVVSPARAQTTPPAPAEPETLSHVVPLPEVVVSTARADERTPVAKTVLKRDELQRLNWGQDTPMALAGLPGAYSYSDAGNGIGYSYLTIRGFPQRRISVLINGVPLNDPESHEVYWIDHPDLLSSTSEVQLQRGVGSAIYGAASLGGSVNLDTAPFGSVHHTSATLAYGSYNTWRTVLELDSGNLAGGWNVYGRYSRIETDGYRDQSWSKLWSYAFAARKVAGNHSVRLNLYGGPEQTHLAYLGVPLDNLDGLVTGDRDKDRRFNPLTYPGEADHFFEPHYELIHSWSPRPTLAVSQTLFYFDGSGYYDEQRSLQALADYRLNSWATYDPTLFGADSLAYYANNGATLTRDAQGRVTVTNFDAVRRRWVANRHYGWVPRARMEHGRGVLTVGGELRFHDGHHIGTVLSGNGVPPGTTPDHVYYDYHPRTLSGGLYAREEWRPSSVWQITGDLGWRHQSYAMRGDVTDPVFHPAAIQFDQSYDFLNPRLGVTWTPRADITTFAAWSYASREPAFRDLYDAEGVGSVPLYADAAQGTYNDPLIKPEHVHDFEVGSSWHRGALALTGNLFRMNFSDELVYAGQFNTDLGYPITGNAARSIHQGVELSARYEWPLGTGTRLLLDGNATLSDNHFVEYSEFDEFGNETRYDGKAIGFFPAALGNVAARLAWSGATLGAETQLVGRQYLDNTEDRAGSIAPHAVLNLTGGYRLARVGRYTADASVRVFNVLDERYETSGYSYLFAGTRYTDFIPAATRNALAQVRLEF